MRNIARSPILAPAAEMAVDLFDNWFDPIEAAVRARAREFIQELIRGELDTVLARPRYGRSQMVGDEEVRTLPATATGAGAVADRHVRPDRDRRAARQAEHHRRQDDGVEEQGAAGLPAAHACRRRADRGRVSRRHQYTAGTPGARGAVWRRGGQGHGEPGVAQGADRLGAWNARSLAEEPIVRLILDGTVVRVRLDRKATSISLLVVLGVREDGQKVLFAIKSMGGESTEAWRAVLDDLIKRGLRRPEFLIVDGAPGWRRRLPPSGMACRCSGAQFTSTATCSPMRPSACMRRSAPTTAT